MVQRMIRADLCDLTHDAEEAAVTRLAVEIGAQRWELDACQEHADYARGAWLDYIEAGRATTAKRGHAVIRRTAAQRRAADEIRQWAREQPEFADVAELGRLPRAAVMAAQEKGIGLELEGAAGRRLCSQP